LEAEQARLDSELAKTNQALADEMSQNN